MRLYIVLAVLVLAAPHGFAAEPVNDKRASPQLHKAEPAGAKAQMKKVEPCCSVVTVNAASGVVTLRDVKTGGTFDVRVQNKARLNGLRVGQRVDRNL
jgi:hypothetical protein